MQSSVFGFTDGGTGAVPTVQQEIQRQAQSILSSYVNTQGLSQSAASQIYNAVVQNMATIETELQRSKGGPQQYYDQADVFRITGAYISSILNYMRSQAMAVQQQPAFATPGFGMPGSNVFTAPGGNAFFGAPGGGRVFATPTAQPQTVIFGPSNKTQQQPQPAPAAEVPAPMVTTSRPFSPPTQVETVRLSGDVVDLIGLSVWREANSQRMLDLGRFQLTTGYADEYEVAKAAIGTFRRVAKVHDSFMFTITYPRLRLIRESPQKVLALLTDMRKAVSREPGALESFKHLLTCLNEAPWGLSQIMSSLLLERVLEKLHGAIWTPKTTPEGVPSNVLLEFAQLADVNELVDRNVMPDIIRQLVTTSGTGYSEYIQRVLQELINSVKAQAICDPKNGSDMLDILTAYGDITIDGVSARSILAEVIDTRAASAENKTDERVVNRNKFLTKYTVLREDATLMVTNVVPVRLMAKMPQFSSSLQAESGDESQMFIRVDQPTDLLEWTLSYNQTAAPLLVIPNTAGYVRLYLQIAADGVPVLFPCSKH